MRPLLRPHVLFVLFSYLALSTVPFSPLLFDRPVEAPGRIVAIEFIAWLTSWAAFARPARFHWLLLPAFLLLPAELYLQAYYNQAISPHHLGIIVETSPKESLEFLGDKVWFLAGALLAVTAWWAWSWRAALRAEELDWRDDSRWITIALLSTVFAVWMYGNWFGV